jgi:hypothetical protein
VTALLGFIAVALLATSVVFVSRRRDARAAVANAAIALPASQASWTTRVNDDGVPVSAAQRVGMVERLAVLGSAWSVGVLEAALDDEPDAAVRDAIWRALIAVRSAF